MPKKVKFAGTRWLSKRPKQKRIRIKQPGYRPLKVYRKQPDKMRQEGDEIVVHRRGPRRDKVGLDYQESRAQQGIKGTLPERIFYKALVQRGYKPNVDFDFQSSQAGGRMQMGGIVADFLFPFKKIVVQVQGPTHSTWVRAAKDQEQRELLETMGYTTLEIDQDVIFSAAALDAWMRQNIDICLFAGISSTETVSSFQKHTQEG